MKPIHVAVLGMGVGGLATAVMLARQGHTVVLFDQMKTPGPIGSGFILQPNGLDVLERETPDLVITDINMPKMDGFGFIEGARRIDRFRVVPILVLTTESDPDKKMRAKNAGATGWIVKPFDPVKLVDVIRRVAA